MHGLKIESFVANHSKNRVIYRDMTNMTFGPTGENFRSARCARGKNLILAYFIHRNITKSIQSRRKYHRAEKDADVYFGRTTQN